MPLILTQGEPSRIEANTMEELNEELRVFLNALKTPKPGIGIRCTSNQPGNCVAVLEVYEAKPTSEPSIQCEDDTINLVMRPEGPKLIHQKKDV
jgi:hypothetical protein